ncbi:MAG: hypothetical protein IJD91_01090 [Clostridia bacterium]|nr:hypothetical protein [Clostridia bacterium]
MPDTIKRTQIWKGLNRMPYIADGEMRDMKNLASDSYPFITTRKGRKPYTFTTRIPSPEGEAYTAVESLPEASIDELGNIYKVGDVFYECYYEPVYSWKETEYIGENDYKTVDVLPETSGEELGKIYKVGDVFYECYYEPVYNWRETEHPEVTIDVTLKEYLEEYEGCGLKEIIEIEKFDGSIAVLFIDNKGKTRLFHNKDLYDVYNVSGEPGKKLITVGNRLIVGESGNYLHIKDGEKTFHPVGKSFSLPASGSTFIYGNGGTKYKRSYARSENGRAEINLYSSAGQGINYSAIAEGLQAVGTGFSITIKDKTYYMKTKSVDFKEDYVVAGWVVAGTVFEDRADILTIKATESLEDFEYDSKSRALDITFASTDPHYYDVVAWKKRLWGYDNNVFHGTTADIFNDDGMIGWIGEEEDYNTYIEPISQPLWQGGKITGIAALMGGLVYFKDDCITVVTGNYPAVMSSDTISCMGLPPENRDSVSVTNESVYYLSEDGIYRFGGGIPQNLSRDAKINGTNAVGASDGNKYWISLQESSGDYALYVYDINYGVWHKEDNTQAVSFTVLGAEMHMATKDEIYNINAPQEDVEWSFELWYDEDTHRKKKYKEFIVRGYVGECEMFIKADGGEWKLIKAAEEELRAKIPPFECEELGILIRGKGICEIKSIDRVFEVV